MESELKFVVPNSALSPALNIIKALCTKDAKNPIANVSSIYYDSLSFDSLNEKVNSDYYKSKVRLRWYQDYNTQQLSEKAYAEAKFRIGSQRKKYRVASTLTPKTLESISLDDHSLSNTITQLQQNGILINKPVFPTLLIQYTRQRFIDPVSGNRISIDNQIKTSRWSQRMLPGASTTTLQNAVIEIKGNSTQLPIGLQILTQFGVRKSSFSKYLSCFSRCHQITFDPR